MNRRFYSGNTLDQALMKAARDLGVPKEELDYSKIEKKHGFLKIRRSVVIEVDPEAPRRVLSDDEAIQRAQTIEPEVEAPAARHQSTPEPTPEPVSAPEVSPATEPQDTEGGMVELPAGPRPLAEKFPKATGASADALREALEMLLDLADVDMESSVLQGDERLEVELWGPDQDRLLRDSGRPLLSLQHLAVRIVRGMTGEAVFCRIDCDGFHELREERLRDLAQRIAGRVTSSGRSELLESMAPDERRIVHITLGGDPGVETESQGNGYFKRIKVLPA